MVIRVALIWEQFAPYHIDRIEAVGRRLAGRAEVLAIEVATASATYDWKPSGAIRHATKVTLFPDQRYEQIHPLRRLWRQWRQLKDCTHVFIGISYARLDIIILSWVLQLLGRRVVMISDAKFDDRVRLVSREWAKGLLLCAYDAALVAGKRHHDFVRMLGFRRRKILPGCDTVGVERIRREAGDAVLSPFQKRYFICVARFVPKKNLFGLVDVYSKYVELSKAEPRKLILVGSGPLEDALRRHAAALGISDRVEFTGFLSSIEVSRLIAGSLALLLLSTEEQWGLVVNEAIALGIPPIVSHAVGASDLLVRNLVNGFIFEDSAIDGPARAMVELAANKQLWLRMSNASRERAWLADEERFADAVEALSCEADASSAFLNIARFEAVLAEAA